MEMINRLYSDISSDSDNDIDIKNIIDELEIIECGLGREIISSDCLCQINEKTKYYIVKDRIGEGVFRLYENGSERFLLSAKKEKNTFYISQYESIPKDIVDSKHWCAIIKKDHAGNYNLYNNGCECCDDHLNKYSCGQNDVEDRQCLFSLHQYDQYMKEAKITARHIKIDLPKVDSNNNRDSWCPRFQKKDCQKVKSKLPRWNSDICSLSLPFPGGRVRASSSKNFILEDDQNEILMVYGKYGHQKYALDIYKTLCPIQAFGIALTMYSWKN